MNEVKTKQLAPIDALKQQVEAMRSQFKIALPKHVSLDRFMRTIFTAIQNNPDLAQADKASFLSACMKSAAAGLEPDGKSAVLLSFKNNKTGVVTVTYIPMLSGILKLVRQSGELESITSQVVYSNDRFRYFVDSSGEHIEHEPNLFADRGAMIGAYALAKTKDGGLYVEVMTNEQIQAVKNTSRSKDFGPWAGPFASEMIRKTVLKRLSKRLPMSTDVDDVIHADDDLYDFKAEPGQEKNVTPDQAPQIEAKPVKPKSKIERIVEAKTNVTKQQTPAKEDEPRNEVGASELPL